LESQGRRRAALKCKIRQYLEDMDLNNGDRGYRSYGSLRNQCKCENCMNEKAFLKKWNNRHKGGGQ